MAKSKAPEKARAAKSKAPEKARAAKSKAPEVKSKASEETRALKRKAPPESTQDRPKKKSKPGCIKQPICEREIDLYNGKTFLACVESQERVAACLRTLKQKGIVPDQYQVSVLGRVRGVFFLAPKILTGPQNTHNVVTATLVNRPEP